MVSLLRLIRIVKNILHESKEKLQRLTSIAIGTISVIKSKEEQRNKNNTSEFNQFLSSLNSVFLLLSFVLTISHYSRFDKIGSRSFSCYCNVFFILSPHQCLNCIINLLLCPHVGSSCCLCC